MSIDADDTGAADAGGAVASGAGEGDAPASGAGGGGTGNAGGSTPATPTTPATPRPLRTTLTPMTESKWVTPGLAAYVVSAVAIALLAIVGFALWELRPGTGTTPTADPNAGTIGALAGAGIAALTSLTAAYFGIKVATEQSAQSAATTARALEVLGNSTTNGNPTVEDF